MIDRLALAITGNPGTGTIPDRWQWTGALLGGAAILWLGGYLFAYRGDLVAAMLASTAGWR